MAQPARSITFSSGTPTLEGVLHLPDDTPAAAAVICHPGAQYGGDMHNHVVMALCEALNERGYIALRFNMQGVGASEGTSGSGPEEQRDLEAALRILERLPGVDGKRLALVGYSFGAGVVLGEDVHQAFKVAEQIQDEEGRYFVHPFEGPAVALGTGTVGLEICEQCEDFDALVVPVGGGGLIAGVANAVKQLRPACEVIGVEPEGADSMHRSFASGKPESIDKVRTIADSLGAPFAAPYSFSLCQQHVDRLTLVDDTQLRRAMGFLFRTMRIAIEPACAASTAALSGPLREDLRGKRVVLIMCGSNIDWQTFEEQAIFEDVD